jgi:hypothetical protein
MLAYCIVCRKKVEIKNPKPVTFKNGRKAMQGIDAKGHKVSVILGKK